MNAECELLKRYAASGDEAAFAAVVHHHINLVYATALRVANGDAALAEDAAQSVFADLARKAGPLSGHATLAGWLHTSARFAAAKAVRAERTRRDREQEAAAMSEPPPCHDPAWPQLRPLIDEAIGQLREVERDALLLRFFEDKSHREVGDALGLNENAARMRIDRALEKLRRFFNRRGVATTAALLGAALGAQAASPPAPAGLAAAVAGKSMSAAGAAGAGFGGGMASRWRFALAGAASLALLSALGYSLWPAHETHAPADERGPRAAASAMAAAGSPAVVAPLAAVAQAPLPSAQPADSGPADPNPEAPTAQNDRGENTGKPEPADQRDGGPKVAGPGITPQPDGVDLASLRNPASTPAATGGKPSTASAPPPRPLDGLGIVMMPIPAGKFTLGNPDAPASGAGADEKPLTEIVFEQLIWMSRTEITQAQWAAVMGTDLAEHVEEFQAGGNFKPAQAGGDLPMIFLSHEDAAEFSARLNSRERAAGRVPAGFEYRLPTEAEWEYACRAEADAGAATEAPSPNPAAASSAGDGAPAKILHDPLALLQRAAPAPAPVAPGGGGPSPVGRQLPNAWGLHDMLGNAAEWSAGSYLPYPGGKVSDPAVLYQKYSGGEGVLRGGHWLSGAQNLRATDRAPADKLARLSTAGFRVVLAPQLRSAGACVTQQPGGPWVLRHANTTKNLNNVVYDGRRFIIVGQDGTMLVSEDGIRWADTSLPDAPTLRGIATNGTMSVAVGDEGAMYESYNGANWTRIPWPARDTLWSVKWCGNIFIATGENGTVVTSSTDARGWGRRPVPLKVRIFDVAYNGNLYLATADSGNYLTSRDGHAWRAEKFAWPLWTHGIIWAQGRFIALANPACPPNGTNPFIVTSGTGSPGSWSARAPKRSMPDCVRMMRPAEALNGIIAVGDHGIIQISRDGVAWDKSMTGVTIPLGAVAASQTMAVAVGNDGAILTATLASLGLVPPPSAVIIENVTDTTP